MERATTFLINTVSSGAALSARALKRIVALPVNIFILGALTLGLSGCYTQLAATEYDDYDDYDREPAYVEVEEYDDGSVVERHYYEDEYYSYDTSPQYYGRYFNRFYGSTVGYGYYDPWFYGSRYSRWSYHDPFYSSWDPWYGYGHYSPFDHYYSYGYGYGGYGYGYPRYGYNRGYYGGYAGLGVYGAFGHYSPYYYGGNNNSGRTYGPRGSTTGRGGYLADNSRRSRAAAAAGRSSRGSAGRGGAIGRGTTRTSLNDDGTRSVGRSGTRSGSTRATGTTTRTSRGSREKEILEYRAR